MRRKDLWRKELPPPLRKNRGFTLIEMLLVVAIIAILIAVSIPAASSALERAKCATDAANERAAKSYVMARWALGEFSAADKRPGDKWVEYKYDATNGTAIPSKDSGNNNTYGKCAAHKDGRIVVFVCPNCGYITTAWKLCPKEYTRHDLSDVMSISAKDELNITDHGCGIVV